MASSDQSVQWDPESRLPGWTQEEEQYSALVDKVLEKLFQGETGEMEYAMWKEYKEKLSSPPEV